MSFLYFLSEEELNLLRLCFERTSSESSVVVLCVLAWTHAEGLLERTRRDLHSSSSRTLLEELTPRLYYTYLI